MQTGCSKGALSLLSTALSKEEFLFSNYRFVHRGAKESHVSVHYFITRGPNVIQLKKRILKVSRGGMSFAY